MPFKLTGVENDYRFELHPGTTMVVGRAVNSDCAVVDATVSRRHAELGVQDHGVQVKDVGSSNGNSGIAGATGEIGATGAMSSTLNAILPNVSVSPATTK